MAARTLDWRLYHHFRRLVTVTVAGRRYRLPENNPLLRGFQFLAPDCLTYGDFCWNARCHNCVVVVLEGAPHGMGRYLSCQLEPAEGMCLDAPPRGIVLPHPDHVQVYAGIDDGREPEKRDGPSRSRGPGAVDDGGPRLR